MPSVEIFFASKKSDITLFRNMPATLSPAFASASFRIINDGWRVITTGMP